MSPATGRLSPLDASFLAVESETAHMHVGWAALFSPPANGERPRFRAVRDHIAGRLSLAPRYRQKLVPVPFGLADPVWVDDEDFDIANHVHHARSKSLDAIVDQVMSTQLDRERPLWELWIADRLPDGRIGIVGKAHHCMVDGLAAVELGALLLDPTPDPVPVESAEWEPRRAPTAPELLAGAARDRIAHGWTVASLPLRLAANPGQALGLTGDALRSARALLHAAKPAPPSVLNAPISPQRHLARTRRSLDDLRRIKGRFDATLNDVVLAVSSGALRRYLERRREEAISLKTMVPVNVRDDRAHLGNHISFTFVDLPCDEPNPARRLMRVASAMRERKESGEPEAANQILNALALAPRTVRQLVSRVMAQPRTFNLVVSNIPGPREPLYMLGCELEEVYPVVPIPERHGLAIGLTTLQDEAFFGIYADQATLPDAEVVAESVDESIDELLALT
jgi:diacylglycerol O-acyltransferase